MQRHWQGWRRPHAARTGLRLSAWPASLAFLALSACTTLGPDYVTPTAPLQQAWSSPVADSGDDGAAFWASFHSPTLNALLAKARHDNPGLAGSAEQLEQALAQLGNTQAAAWPTAQLVGSSNHAQPDLFEALKGKNAGATTDQLLGQVSWEIDFWGKQRRARESAHADIDSAQAALGVAQVSLDASVASAYCNVQLLRVRIAVAEDSAEQQTEALRVAQARFMLGASSELEWRMAQSQHRQTDAALPPLRAALLQYQHALSVLTGATPDYYASTYNNAYDNDSTPDQACMPEVPASLASGTPSDLLRRRPDVVQAERQAAAQSARIGVAEAALYPSFSLNGSLGFSTRNGADQLFQWDSRALSRGLGFTLPLFDRDRLHAEVSVEDSRLRQALLNYQQTVLKAQQEVEDQLTQVAALQERMSMLETAALANSRSAALSLSRYRAGQLDYSSVSSTQLARQLAVDTLLQARGALALAYIGSYRALGGGWQLASAPASDSAASDSATSDSASDSAPSTLTESTP